MMLNWKRATEVAQSITERWDHDHQPGGAIVLFDREQIQAACCGGLADLAQGTPFSTSSVVRFASVTKHLFAALVTGPMADKIALTDTLAQHLPQLTGPNGQVTVGQALDMTSGLDDIRETLSLLGLSVYNATQAADLLQFEADMGALNYPAGSEISYSNTGYRLVEEALKAKGILFEDLLQRHVCAPLNIHLHAPETWFDIVPGLVPGYWQGENGWQLASAGLHLSASGSVTGSVRDLSVWLQALLSSDGPGAGVLARLCAPRRLADGRVTGYGLGIAHTQLGAAHLVGHGGSHAGYKTYFLLDPEQGAGVVLVANREDVATYDGALRIMAALLEQPLPQPGHALTRGLYASDGGGDWLEISGDTACWLGASDTLYLSEDPAEAASLSSHMPMRLRQNGAAIEGEIGHVPRRFLPVQADDGIERAQGRWFCPQWRSELAITGDRLVMGIGPAAVTASLISLGKRRLLATAQDGPWEKRFAIQLEDNSMTLLLNRSRVVKYQR
ncbi:MULTISPECIES: serine hydrolase domain-containing protein [unclassified Brenneria]|uniref:serine hydrolase domain-containing protein n=1 Tax=unclassified Brenneria TaxID=2634434 RepID=UPI0029C5B5D2|nr:MULTISPECIES: serine hydrolase domain-containing protein [unclassified Brenneria]MDX5629752.1 serine hydrolase domain-containing protein [Brenneria sp. L3-3Z]MDX5696898.1 serine hydrolase domain-containing protein [Brenneria sp. L4-2C]